MVTANEVFRDYETDGVPSSDEHKVKKSDVRRLLTGYEGIINAFLSNGGLIYASKASLDADLAHAANSMAWVIGDPVAANNGVYGKVGASGTGSWTRRSDLPFSFIVASDAGAGTPNAIQGTTSIPVSGSALVWMNVYEENTGSPVTVSFNGGSALTIKTNTGNDVAPGGLISGMIVLGIVSGSTFRILNDQISSAIVAEAEYWASVAESFVQNVNPMAAPFNAVGNGVADDYPALEAACRAAEGKTLYIPAGTYRMGSGSPRIGSNTIVVLSQGAVIVQPNFYSYNRPTEPYVRQNVVDWNGFYMNVGTQNVYILGGGEIRGPFYQASSAAYSANPVQNWPASNGIHARGHDYEWRHDLPLSQTPSKNIHIENIRIEGFAEDAIQLDQVDNIYIDTPILKRCGRGGVRFYGCVNGWLREGHIGNLYPGDYLNSRIVGGVEVGGNRMYGVTATRCYLGDLSIDRASENIWVENNTFDDIPYWKCMDTHGGVNIRFLYNKCYNSHIGVGIDKGGFTVEDGIAPPRNIWVIGNRFIRTLPDDPNEGDSGVAGAAIFAVAHDQTDAQVGQGLIVDDNICVGWGEDTKFGALVVSNFIGVQIGGKNQFNNSRRSAICIRERFEGDIADGIIIDDVRRSSLGVQDGIAIETDNAVGRIGAATFINRQSTALRAIFLNNPSAGMGFKLAADHVFRQLGSGTITKVVNANNDQLGPWTQQLRAAARVNSDGTISGSRGVASVTKTATGTYTVVLSEALLAASSNWPIASSRGGSTPVAQADSVDASTITVLTKNASGALTDGGFVLHVFGY
ncbi:hypothetical protein I7I49_15325 [Sinorhizobium meliloti]|uniref:right-handed parallel beta-helix repeat-containing protein n=1 Tax=Rhizobium meliloti TaxID=382 RepID=UPI00237F0913|nr:right-handed parallel beta-helix repeat-containing protein [Sinorhizobium meliloti]MDE3811646.1 hypothetical protein [Sinorhizobium meliloti]